MGVGRPTVASLYKLCPILHVPILLHLPSPCFPVSLLDFSFPSSHILLSTPMVAKETVEHMICGEQDMPEVCTLLPLISTYHVPNTVVF